MQKNKPASLKVKARLLNGSFAHFYDRFHGNETIHNNKVDSFYKKIEHICNEHKQLTRSDIIKSPYNADGFYFKAEPYTKCVNKAKQPCIIDDLYDKDVLMYVKIIPYDLIDKSTQQRRVGIVIKVSAITGI